MQYIFTAVFTKDEDDTLLVSFPDLPGCYAQGTSMIDAVKKAESVLSLCLFDMEQQGIKIPEARYPDAIEISEDEVTSIVLTDTDTYHMRFGKKMAEHVVTMPIWLSQIAESSGIDVSGIVQDAIKREIGMPVHKNTGMNAAAAQPTQASSSLQYDESYQAYPQQEPQASTLPVYETYEPPVEVPIAMTPYMATTDATTELDYSVESVPVVSPFSTPTYDPNAHAQPAQDPVQTPVSAPLQEPKSDVSPQPESTKVVRKRAASRKGKADPKFMFIMISLSALVAVFGILTFAILATTWLDDVPFFERFTSGQPAYEENDLSYSNSPDDEYPQDENDYEYGNDNYYEANTDDIQTEQESNTSDDDYHAQNVNGSLASTEPDLDAINASITALAEEFDNADVIGRIVVGGTSIDYAVVQAADNMFYRMHDAFGEPSEYGWVFMDAQMLPHELAPHVAHPNNFVFHGSITGEGMFSELTTLTNFEAFQSLGNITLTTHFGEYTFEPFSFYVDHGSTNFTRAVYRNWGAWIANFAQRSIHASNVTVDEYDRIITLVAFNADDAGARYILHARKIIQSQEE